MTVLVVACGEPAIQVEPGEAIDESGKADAADGNAELKVTIDASEIRKARSRLGLLNDLSETRRIWFYDTPALAIFEAGAILRAREIDGDADDSTVKLRPFTLAELAPEFRALDELKCEIDRLQDGSTSSCSLKIEQDEGEISEVDRGDREIDKLFSSEQEAMFATHGPDVAWDAVVALGPISARVWTLRTAALPEKVTAELWYMPDGGQVLELSMKVEVDDADDAMAELIEFVDDRGLSLAKLQESKTRQALEALAATLP